MKEAGKELRVGAAGSLSWSGRFWGGGCQGLGTAGDESTASARDHGRKEVSIFLKQKEGQ